MKYKKSVFNKLTGCALLFASFAQASVQLSFKKPTTPTHSFISVHQGHFVRDGARYAYLGANFWQGMNLGSNGIGGDRARLERELDRLKALGVMNLRVLGASEGPDSEPWRIVPALQKSPGVYDADLLQGLDFLLSAMAKREMTAVIILNNFWDWSGGMAQYVRWAGGDSIPYSPPAANGSWNTFENYSAQFYKNKRAKNYFDDYLQMILSRRNSITGNLYKDDTAIMAWELGNEPRGMGNEDAFNQWIDDTSSMIKAFDPNHLVTTGTEGHPSGAGVDFERNNGFHGIDYCTSHIWVQNWGWFDPMNADQTFDPSVQVMQSYFQSDVDSAKKIGKPVVLEEFGLARDLDSFDPRSTTTYRDLYYGDVFQTVLNQMESGAPVGGVNFWAWAGEATPPLPLGNWWKPGDPFLGDPPHEHQGWYSVYANDSSTLKIITTDAAKISSLTVR